MTEFADKEAADEEIIQRALAELRAPTLAATRQYLEIHDVVRVDGKPTVERLDRVSKTAQAIVYFPIKDEKFHLAIYLSTRPSIEITGVGTEPEHRIYFRATSETLNASQLSALTTLEPTMRWNKGEPREVGGLPYRFSMIEFRPNPEPDEFVDKLRKLLDFLEKDRAGVRDLVDKAGGYIQVSTHCHNGNGMIGGSHLSKDAVKRLCDLNLEIDFDLYVGGAPFRELD